jgi:PhoH-like ATPase
MDVKKTYVLDTNVLIHDPESLFKFDEHTVAVPVEVLSELDRLKTQPGQLGASARRVNRSIRALFENRPLKEIAEGDAQRPGALHAKLRDGGELRVVINESLIRDHFNGARSERVRAVFMQVDAPDHRIIASALYLRDTTKGSVVLVTKDACMALKAQALGLEVQDYRNDRIEVSDVGDYRTITVTTAAMRDFRELGQAQLKLAADTTPVINEYVMLASDSWTEPARHVGEGAFVPLSLYREFLSNASGARKGLQMPRGMRVIPKNFEQWIFLDALLNPEIKLVTCFGRAGTGKTFLSIAAALAQVLSDFSPYKKLYVSRPVVQIGKDIGALPGSKEEKLSPYIQPYFDNLEVLFSKNSAPASAQPTARELVATDSRNKKKKAQAMKAPQPIFGSQFQPVNQPRKPYQWLIDSGLIEIEAMTFIRGRSIGHAFMIVDEAQNMTPHEAKTVITRIGEGSKLVLIGDLDQVDTPYLDGKSNGLIHTHERMKGHAITANVRLLHGVRSALSELAAQVM